MAGRPGRGRRLLFKGICICGVTAALCVGPIGLVSAQAVTSPDPADAFPPVAPEAVGLDPTRLAELVDLTQSWVDDGRIVGAEILIVKDRKTVLHEAVGWSDAEAGRAMERGSIFRLRSMTKPFTGTAALMLVKSGALQIDARVAEYLPSWRNSRSQGITVEQLLTHFSGFEQGGTPEPASSYPDLRAVVDASGAQGPQHDPGERFIYSDVNTFTLGSLVTELSGVPLDQFIRERIVGALGLPDLYVGFSPAATWAARTNPTYDRDEAGEWEKYWTPGEDLLFPWFRASGGMFSSPYGYARWLDAWLDESTERGLVRSGPGALLTPDLVSDALALHGADEIAGYGYHWEIWDEEPLVFGHGGSDGTVGIAIPAERLILLYFTQSRGNGTRAEWFKAARRATSPTGT